MHKIKLLLNIKFEYFSLKENHKILIFGPEAQSYLKYLEKNYFYINPKKKIIFNFILLLPAIILFFYYFVKKPKVVINLRKLWPKIFFYIALIKIKKIKKVISFVDYNPWPNNIKKIIGNSIITVGFQNSSRAYPLEPLLLGRDFDGYCIWNYFSNLNQLEDKKKKIIRLGALKSHLVINNKNLWSKIKHSSNNYENEKVKNLYLISTFHNSFFPFYNKYLKNSDLKDYENLFTNIENKIISNNFFGKIKDLNKREKIIPKKFFYYQGIEFYKLCFFLKKYVEEEKANLFILDRHEKERYLNEEEKFFYLNLFNQDCRLKLDPFKKIEYILNNNNNNVFITNLSSLGRECLALNKKCLFFSSLLHFYNPDFFDKNSIFCSINESYEEFKKRLNALFFLTPIQFTQKKENLKKTVSSITPSKQELKDFLGYTGLRLI